VHASAPVTPDSRDRNALSTSAEVADASIKTATQHVSATVDASHFAELAAGGFFDSAAEADVDKALDRVVEGLRAVEGLERGGLARVGHVSRGFASADFARLVEGAVKAKLKAEASRLIRASPTSGVIRDEFDRFTLNAAAAVDTALGFVYSALGQRWEAVARLDVIENYAHVLEKSPRGLKVRKRGVVHFLRYNVGDVAYGAVEAKGVVVLVFLGGKESIRVEVLAKSVAGLPIRFEEVEWGGERWVRLAAAWINKPKKYVVQIKPRLRLESKVRGGAASVEGLSGLLVTDASGKVIKTPDPLLAKLFIDHFKKAKVEVAGVSVTKAGFALQFRAVATDKEPFRELFGDIAKRYGKKLKEVMNGARDMWRETVRKLHEDIKRVAEEAAEVGRGEDVEAVRRALVEGLRRLFEEREREALNAGRLDDALAIAVAGRLTVGIVNSQWEWFSLLVGDGVVDIPNKTLGFSAKYGEVAETVLRLLAVWAGAYETKIRVEKEEHLAVYASSEDAAKVLRAVLMGEVIEYAVSLARSWNGLAGADTPKLISLLALAQLLGIVEGKWAVELWLAHKAATTLVKPEVTQVLDGLLARIISIDEVKWKERGVSLSFRLRGMEDVSRAVTLRLYTDFAHFRLSCDCSGKASARRVLEAVVEWLRPAVERLELTAKERPKWHGDALVLSAEVGWAMLLRLWKVYNTSYSIRDGDRELLRVEVLEARADGTAKFRQWYYKWHETRPEQPYVDVEITYRGKRQGFIGHVSVNLAKGLLREHLAEIARLLKRRGVEGVAYYEYKKSAYLRFTGVFRDSMLKKLGIKQELPPGEPPAVQYLGGLKFRVGNREVEFGNEFYAKLTFPSGDEAERFASSLKTIGVYAEVAGNTVRLDKDSFFGLLAATDATPPGLTPLYHSEEGDLRVNVSMEGGRMRFYFAMKYEGVWRAVEGLYREGNVQLKRTEREVIEAIRSAMAKALEKLVSEQQGRSAEVGEPKERVDEKGSIVGYYFKLYGPHITPFLEHAAERVEAMPVEVRLEGRRIVVKAGDVKAEVEFKLLKGKEADILLAQDVRQTLALYKSLKEVGVPVEITSEGVRVGREAMWALVAAAVERDTPSKLPAEVMPCVELLNVHSAGGMRLYIFRAAGDHYYFVVKTGESWRVTGGKHTKWHVQIAGESARTVAEAINAIYREMGVERKVEVRDNKKGVPYINLTNEDMRLLGLPRASQAAKLAEAQS